eukprot:362854-Chlamydomonas_euryale.AAC.7
MTASESSSLLCRPATRMPITLPRSHVDHVPSCMHSCRHGNVRKTIQTCQFFRQVVAVAEWIHILARVSESDLHTSVVLAVNGSCLGLTWTEETSKNHVGQGPQTYLPRPSGVVMGSLVSCVSMQSGGSFALAAWHLGCVACGSVTKRCERTVRPPVWHSGILRGLHKSSHRNPLIESASWPNMLSRAQAAPAIVSLLSLLTDSQLSILRALHAWMHTCVTVPEPRPHCILFLDSFRPSCVCRWQPRGRLGCRSQHMLQSTWLHDELMCYSAVSIFLS